MARRNAVVRKMTAVETLGSVTTICTDKTGTLTEGKMKVEDVWVFGKSYSLTGSSMNPEGQLIDSSTKSPISNHSIPHPLELFMMVSALCNNAEIRAALDDKKMDTRGEWEVIGDPTEVALQFAASKVKMGKHSWIHNKKFSFQSEAPFDSDRKRMTVCSPLPLYLILIGSIFRLFIKHP